MVVWKQLHGSVKVAAWQYASGCMVVCKRLCVVVQAAMWCCASGYVVVCKWLCGGGDFSVSPRPLGFGAKGFGAWA